MNIRKAEYHDFDSIEQIYKHARAAMKKNHNPFQWGDSYPDSFLIQKDISQEICFVCEEKGEILGVFAFMIGADITYTIIENGKWLNEDPYGTIHRLASGSKKKGIADLSIDWCFERCRNLRADTHRDNRIMQHVLQKNRFIRCGTIYAPDHTLRIAYQKVE